MPPLLSVAIGTLDAFVVLAYIAATTLFGIVLGRGQTGNRDFFLASHRLPTWALLVSIVATETSTVTFLSIPGLTYVDHGNFTFLQLAIGYIVGRLAIVAWLLPGYFRGEMLSAYQVLEQRFGLATRRLASLVFLVMRNLADGLRLFLTALALNIALGLDLLTCIVVTSIATAIYSCVGGVRSVVWNDCIQFAVYMFGAFSAAWLLLNRLPGGWSQIVEFGQATGRFHMFDFDLALNKPQITFWSGCIGGAFLSLATHGADQLIVQRYLCARSRSAASWALIWSGVVVFAQFTLFLFIGVQLACFEAATGSTPVRGDQALMNFVVHHMSSGMRGLILAAVVSAAMSTLASSFNASASSLMSDWLGRIFHSLDDRRALAVSRLLTLLFAAAQAGVAIAAYKLAVEDAIVKSVLTIAGFSTGLILGLYFLGLLAPSVPERAAIVAFLAGSFITLRVAFGTDLHWCWYTLVGSGTILGLGLILGVDIRRGSVVARYSAR